MRKCSLFVAALLFSVWAFAQNAAELINKANEALKANQFAQAFEMYEQAMSNLGDVKVDKSINYNIAFAAMQAEKNEAALKYFDLAIEAGTKIPKCYEYKAGIYNKMKDYTNALANYEKAFELSEEKSGALMLNIAVAAFRLENYEKAITWFDKAYEAGYKPEDALFNKAGALKKLNKNDEYLQALILGNEKFPENKKFSVSLAGIYFSEGNTLYKGGVEILNAANKKLNEGKLKATDEAYKAELVKAKAEFTKAREILEKSKQLDPTNANPQKLIDACNQIK
jgi:tetratricopeptide (TPR) repeat protein